MMVSSRSKSCQNCRIAKARCSQSAPCSRCSKRGLDCCYQRQLEDVKSRPNVLREIRPASDAIESDRNQNLPPHSRLDTASTQTHVVGPSGGAIFQTQGENRPAIAGPTNTDGTSTLEDSLGFPTSIIVVSSRRGVYPNAPDAGHKPPVALKSTPSSTDTLWSTMLLDPYFHDEDALKLHSAHMYSVPRSCPSIDAFQQLSTINPAHVSSLKRSHSGPQLQQRGRSLQQGSLTGTLLLSRMTEFTRVFAENQKLPPFIHPPCWSEEGKNCPQNTAHQCLPPILEACVRLLNALYTSKSDSVRFVWQRIYEHLHQIKSEFEAYDERTMLRAVQVAVLYGMACSGSSSSISSEYSRFVVECIETFGRRLFGMVQWQREFVNADLSWTRWILVESIRRLACVLYLIDLLLQSDAKTPSRGDCDTFWDMPLPSYRELFEAATEESWSQQFGFTLKSKKRKGINLGELLQIRRTARLDEVVRTGGDSDIAEELSDWCEHADDLSTLLWMALNVEGEGQRQKPCVRKVETRSQNGTSKTST